MSYEKARDLLEEKYPNCFVPFRSHIPIKPLKKGILKDVMAVAENYSDEIPKIYFKNYLTAYVNRPSYLKCIKTGAKRVDLEGNAVGEVTEDEFNYSQNRQKEKIKKLKKKKDPPKQEAVKNSDDSKAPQKLDKNDEPIVKRKVLSLNKKTG